MERQDSEINDRMHSWIYSDFEFFLNAILTYCCSTQVYALCHMFSSDTEAETYRQHIFKEFPEHRKILIPIGKLSQLKLQFMCWNVRQWPSSVLCLIQGRSVHLRNVFCWAKSIKLHYVFAKYASQKQYCLSSVKNIMGQQCHVKEQYTKLWKIFTREVQDWREKKNLL